MHMLKDQACLHISDTKATCAYHTYTERPWASEICYAVDGPNHEKMPTSTKCVGMQIEASIEELAQEGMEARLAAAQAGSDQAQAACQQAAVAVEAAERELAGAQAGDGRDESNRSLQERLADAQNAQVLCTPCQPLNTLGNSSQSAATACLRLAVAFVMICFSGTADIQSNLSTE